MGEFATVVLGVGLATLGTSLVVSVIWGVQLPSGVTELGVTVLALAGRALLSMKGSGTDGGPPQGFAEPPAPLPNRSGGNADESGDLHGRPSLRE